MPSTTNQSVINHAALDAVRELQDADDPEMLKELIGMFVKSTPERLARMKQAIAGANANDLTFAAHSLKSSSANLGAHTMRDLCEELEKLGNSGTCSGAAELLSRLEVEYEKARAELLANT